MWGGGGILVHVLSYDFYYVYLCACVMGEHMYDLMPMWRRERHLAGADSSLSSCESLGSNSGQRCWQVPLLTEPSLGFFTYVLRQGLSMNSELRVLLVWLVSLPQESHLHLPRLGLQEAEPFRHGCWGSEARPHVYKASVLPPA